uniref:Putative secreted protein n=1 Tax=Amblyomma cajennense TaxID=34607 RepID=A0A023FDH4_AMBCJ
MFFAAVICATLAVLITGDAQQPPLDDERDCNETIRDSHVLDHCTVKCGGDTLLPLNNSERCYLSGATSTEPQPSPVQRTEAQIEGVCQDGICVAKPQDTPLEGTP